MNIFISGSRSITNYDILAPYLDNLISCKDLILVGDASGVDALVQHYCHLNFIPFKVYYIGEKPRNCITKSVKKCFGSSQNSKDIQMTIDCDYGIAFWDGKSKGTRNNILRLKDMNKECKVVEIE